MTYPGEDEYLTELARADWRSGIKEELARHHDILWLCKVCGLEWKEPRILGNTITCPNEEEHD